MWRHHEQLCRAAQSRVQRREGGVLWHTQGSGKSLLMVWLAKWIREHVANSRVLIITDRTELDQQIETVFKGVSEDIYRTQSGADLVQTLNAGTEWLMGSLIHKFGASEEGDINAFIDDIKKNLHVGVYPPCGRVRVAVPRRLNDDAVRLAVVSRLAWIRRQQAEFGQQTRQSEREMVTGESHYFRGRR